MKRRYTIADARASYGPEKARTEWHGDWMSALAYRPVSFWVTPALLNLSVSASQVTVLALLIALLLPLVAFYAGPFAHLAAGFLAIVFAVLDCVDGNIARVTNTASKSGHYLDFLTDIVFRITLYAATGILANGDGAAPAIFGGQYLLLSLLAALVTIISRLARVFVRQLSPGDVYSESPSAKGFFDRFLFPFLSGLDRFLPVLILLSHFWGGLGWVVLWLLAYGVGDFAITQRAIFRRLGKLT